MPRSARRVSEDPPDVASLPVAGVREPPTPMDLSFDSSSHKSERTVALRKRKPDGGFYRSDDKDLTSWQKEVGKKTKKASDTGVVAGIAMGSTPLGDVLASTPGEPEERTVGLRHRKPDGGFYRDDRDDMDSWSAISSTGQNTNRWKARKELGLAGVEEPATPIDLAQNASADAEERTTALRIRKLDGGFFRADEVDHKKWSKPQNTIQQGGEKIPFAGAPAEKSIPLPKVWENMERLSKKEKIERTTALRIRKPDGGYFRADATDHSSWEAVNSARRNLASWRKQQSSTIAGVRMESTPIGDTITNGPRMNIERSKALRTRKSDGTYFRADARDAATWSAVHSEQAETLRRTFKLPGICGTKQPATPITSLIEGMKNVSVEPRSKALRSRKPDGSLYRSDRRDMKHWGGFNKFTRGFRAPVGPRNVAAVKRMVQTGSQSAR